MPAHGHFMRPVVVVNPTTQAAYSIPASPAGTDTIVNVAAGVTLSDSLRFAAGWGADCTVTINVDGTVGGKGGNGGNGGAGISNPGGNGSQGGHGIFINQNIRVYIRVRGSGVIAAGGGGGGGGGGNTHLGVNSGGGGGGGGQGFPGGTGGLKGTSAASDGGDGTTTTFGTGGTAASGGNDGGDGGGLAGEAYPGVFSGVGAAPGSGGQPGAAIYSVGYPAPVILEGNDAAHIKGAITTA